MDQDHTLNSEDLLTSMRALISGDRAQRFLIGFLFGAAFFLIGAGLAEVFLARNEACLDTLSDFRLAPDPNKVCMSEFSFFLARRMSRGPFGTLNSSTSQFIVWPVMAVLFGLIGGGFAQLPLRTGIAGFLIVFVILLMAFMSVDFMSQFIVFE
jgi:TM2 domain-containing membrane protein YozV